MAVKLTPTEFYAALAKRTDLDTETVQKFWEVLDSFVVEELLRNGECYLPLLGNITLRQRGGKNAHVPDPDNDKAKIIYIEPYYQIAFVATEVFKQNINNGRLPRYEIKRERERYRAEKQKLVEAERAKEMVFKQKEAMEQARQKRLNRIARQKEWNKLSKKQKEELEKKEKFEYEYGDIQE